MHQMPPGRPKTFDPAAALAGATDAFWHDGFEATGLEALSVKMGVSKQSIYDTFGNKRELFIAALRKYMEMVTGNVRTMLNKPDTTPADRVRGFLDWLIGYSSTRSVTGCLMTNTLVELAPRDPEVRALVSDTLAALSRAVEKLLVSAKRSGDIPASINPRGFARLIVLVFEGALVMSKSDLAGHSREAIETLKGMLSEDGG